MLEKNENPYPAQIEWAKCLTNIHLNRYPDSDYSELKNKLAKTIDVDSCNLSLGNGSDEVLQSTIFALTSASDEIVSFSPTFSEYKRICELRDSKYVEIKLEPPYTPDMKLMVQHALKYNPKLIILCNPNNPTGQIIKKAEIIYLLENTSAYVIVDEAYIDFGGESVLPYIQKYNNLIVLRTFSKGYGLAALRFGFAISSRSNIERIESKRAPYNVNQFTVAAVLNLLDNLESIQLNIEKIVMERERVQSVLNRMNIPYIESSGNFILFKSRNLSNLKESLSEASFSMRFFDDNSLKSYVRFSFGTEQQNNEVLKMILACEEGRQHD